MESNTILEVPVQEQVIKDEEKIVSSLNKGDYLPPEKCEEILKMARTDPQYGYKLMGLIDLFTRLSERIKKPMSMRCHQLGIKVNTDHEATRYHERERQEGLRKHLRHTNRAKRLVDTNNLSKDDKDRHERSLACADLINTAIKRERSRATRNK
jgi:hypothetical protein